MKIIDIFENEYITTDEEKTFRAILENCKDSLNAFLDGHSIHRGMKHTSETFFLKKSEKKRKPAFFEAGDYYKDVFDKLPSWRALPDRSKSIICSTKSSVAQSFSYQRDGSEGVVYLIFPVDGARIGAVNQHDFHDLVVKQDDFFKHFVKQHGLKGTSAMWYIIDELYKKYGTIPDTLIPDLDNLFDPVSIGLTIESTKDIPSLNGEVWIEDDAYAVNVHKEYDLKVWLSNESK